MMDIEDACKLSLTNKRAVQAAAQVGCYFCIRTFPSVTVTEWCDPNGLTALCPHCGIDAILPGVTDTELLKAASERWFTTAS